jgi:diguanylate cyclase (GGDEF)-like protein
MEPMTGLTTKVLTAAPQARLATELDQFEARPGYDVDAVLARAAEIDDEAGSLGATTLQMRARLVRGDMLDRAGEVAAGARLVMEVNRWAAENDERRLLSRSHLLLSNTFHNLGDPAACLEHAVRAISALDDGAAPETKAQYLVTLANALGWTGSFDEARDRYREAEQLLVTIGDTFRQLNVLNNLAYTEYEAGQPQRAWETVVRMRAVAAAHGLRLDAEVADTIARALIGLGRYAEAEQTLLPYIDAATGYEQVDTLVENLLTLAESQRLQGHHDRAQASLDRCAELCDERGLAEVRVRVLAEQAELCAAVGDFKQAFATYKAFHSAHEALHSVEREAQARVRHALFETSEARKQAERFREQAMRDPLTKLYNRRLVEERLPALLADSVQGGTSLTVAILDLDRFKGINDTLSHEVGDQVLVIFAGLIAAALPAGNEASFAARLGGEEFLLVLTGMRPADAVKRLDRLRLAVADFPWQPVTGGIPVTVSIGVTAAHAESTQASLLSLADRYLYTAKRAGRNCMQVDPGPRLERRRYRA